MRSQTEKGLKNIFKNKAQAIKISPKSSLFWMTSAEVSVITWYTHVAWLRRAEKHRGQTCRLQGRVIIEKNEKMQLKILRSARAHTHTYTNTHTHAHTHTHTRTHTHTCTHTLTHLNTRTKDRLFNRIKCMKRTEGNAKEYKTEIESWISTYFFLTFSLSQYLKAMERVLKTTCGWERYL